MDCKTARLLLDFARPHARELEAEEAVALETHLDHCPDCHIQARDERQFDDHLDKAMRQVVVPAGLRDQLLARLESERSDQQRQRFARGSRRVASAAALLLLVWGMWCWIRDRAPSAIEPEKVADAVSIDAAKDPEARTVEALKQLGVDSPQLPALDYHWLACPPTLAELPGYPGRKVPMLLFVHGGRVARVYVVRDKAIPKDTPDVIPGTSFKAELLSSVDGPYRFLAIYDSADLEWLRPPVPLRA